jgi:rubredoxin-NAD+ reductase
MDPIVIIGSGLAGYTSARALRKIDPDIPLLIITADDGRAYAKPVLSNALARGKDADTLATADAIRQGQALNARILSGCQVERIDPAGRRLITAAGEQPYHKLVLATGARPIRLPIPGNGADDILSVNNLDDYARFRAALAGKKRICLLGPGLIGCEFANDLVNAGYEVDLVGPDPWPISTLLPEKAGRALQAALSSAGIRLHLGLTASHIQRTADGFGISLDNGGHFNTGLVLSAVGLRADTRLAETAGLAVQRGIQVNAQLQTSQPDIYAIGDCAEYSGEVLPYVAPIMQAAPVLAKQLLNRPAELSFPPMPIVIKTPACPVALVPPKEPGEWHFEEDSTGLSGKHLDARGQLTGYVLTGERVTERIALTKALA